VIYFDSAATTHLDIEVLDAMIDVYKHYGGNPSSLHEDGIKARKRMNQVKNELATLLNTKRQALIFTGSGTEATNLAIKGTFYKHKTMQFITTTIEHHATLNTMHFIESLGANVSYLEVDEAGFIDLDKLEELLKKGPSFLSLIYANNEIGTLQPLNKILALKEKYRCILHLDMVQTPSHMPIDVKALGADFISMSAHKFNGPKGIGLLIKETDIQIEPLIHGGQQEFNLRAGTENLANMVGFLEAFKLAMKRIEAHNNHINHIAHYFINQLDLSGIHYRLNGPRLDYSRLNSILNIGFYKTDAQTLAFNLNQEKICVSLGSACDSKNIEVSHVLKAIHVPSDYIDGSMRFSLSQSITEEAIDYTINVLKEYLINE
jgi:cysteine desulfurase